MAVIPIASTSTSGGRLPPDWHLAAFDKQPRTRLLFGNGTVSRVGELAAELGSRRVLLVTDPGIVRAGHAQRVREILLRLVADVAVYDRARENPDTLCVEECNALARDFSPDLIVGLGGGSALDTAKGCNFIHTNGGTIHDYWGFGRAKRPLLPFLAIPTTAGTGSECQSAALIADPTTHMKMACLDPKAAARVAILDPELTVSQPALVTAHTGIDAIAHSVETAVSAKRNAISLMYSHEAFKLLTPNLPRVLKNPTDLAARGRMLLGAALAGTAIELSMLGAAHSAANPLTAHFDVVHGVAVGLMLPHVVRFNGRDADVCLAYTELTAGADAAHSGNGSWEAVETLARRIEDLLTVAGLPNSLIEAGVDPRLLGEMAEEAARQWTANFNPRPVNPAEFEELYRAALQPRAQPPSDAVEQREA